MRYMTVTAGQKTGHTQSNQLDGGALDEAACRIMNLRFDAGAVSVGADVELRWTALSADLVRRCTITCNQECYILPLLHL